MWLKKIGLETVGCRNIFAGAGGQEAGQERGKEKVEGKGGEGGGAGRGGGDLQRNYVVLCICCSFKKVANLPLRKAFPRIQSTISITTECTLLINFGDILQR